MWTFSWVTLFYSPLLGLHPWKEQGATEKGITDVPAIEYRSTKPSLRHTGFSMFPAALDYFCSFHATNYTVQCHQTAEGIKIDGFVPCASCKKIVKKGSRYKYQWERDLEEAVTSFEYLLQRHCQIFSCSWRKYFSRCIFCTYCVKGRKISLYIGKISLHFRLVDKFSRATMNWKKLNFAK